MLNLLVDTNILMYYFVSNSRDRIYAYFTSSNKISLTSQCFAEFQKRIKLNHHTLASVKFSREILNSSFFNILPSHIVTDHEVLNLIEKYSMLRSECSKSRRNRDLSITDSEQILIAKKFNLVLASNDGYVRACADSEGVISYSPVSDLSLDIFTKQELKPFPENIEFFTNTIF